MSGASARGHAARALRVGPSGSGALASLQGGQHPRGRERRAAEAYPGGVLDGIGNDRQRAVDPDLRDALGSEGPRSLVGGYEDGGQPGDVTGAENFVGTETVVGQAPFSSKRNCSVKAKEMPLSTAPSTCPSAS